MTVYITYDDIQYHVEGPYPWGKYIRIWYKFKDINDWKSGYLWFSEEIPYEEYIL